MLLYDVTSQENYERSKEGVSDVVVDTDTSEHRNIITDIIWKKTFALLKKHTGTYCNNM